jgi:RiboL-PSP-HEPN
MPTVRKRTEKSTGRGLGRTVSDPLHSFYLVMLDEFLADPRKLLEWHDEARGASGRPKRDLEVLKIAAVILTVTSWETFIENTLRWTFEDRLGTVTDPRELRGTFREVAREWMKRGKNLADNPERLAEWSADGWKAVVQAEFHCDLDKFHNPGSNNIRRMYQKYLEVDVTVRWRWRGVTSKRACEQLDALVRLRGKVTHRASGSHRGSLVYEPKAAVRLEDAVNAINLIERLAQCTLIALDNVRSGLR